MSKAVGRRPPFATPGKRFTRRAALQAAAAFNGIRAVRCQDEPVFFADVKVVNVLATVRDKRGALIENLDRDDFSLVEDGRPQTIRYFTRETDLPLTLGLMVDTSGSQQRVLGAERGASLRFFDRVFREDKDQVFIVQFDSAVRIRQSLTSSVRKLDDALAYVDTETRRELQIQHGGGTLLYDAVVRASEEVMKKRTGRKALIVLSDGVDVGSYATLKDAVAAAQRTGALIYSILYSDSGFYGILGDGVETRNPDGNLGNIHDKDLSRCDRDLPALRRRSSSVVVNPPICPTMRLGRSVALWAHASAGPDIHLREQRTAVHED